MSYVLTVQTSDGGKSQFTEPSFTAALTRLKHYDAGINRIHAVSIVRRGEPCPSDPPTHRA